MSLVDLGKKLLDASKKGDADEVRSLMSNGAPFTTDWLGTSPLHFAAQLGHAETAEVLLRAGISRDARTKVDRTSLHLAAQEGHVAVVAALLKHKADVDAKDMLRMTPLHWAVEKSHVEVIQMLLDHGADVSSVNKFDKSPIDIAYGNGRLDILHLLQLNQTNTVEVTETVEIAGSGVMQDHEEEVVTETNGAASPLIMEPLELKAEIRTSSPKAAKRIRKPLRIKTATISNGTDGDGRTQNSTAVLSTLAELAAATGPLTPGCVSNSSAAEALQWLEAHGFTMITSQDNTTIVSSALETGQTLTLTEAGRLALNYVKSDDTEEVTVDEASDDAVQGQDVLDDQNVITIVSDLQQTDEDSRVLGGLNSDDNADDEEPLMKRIKLSSEDCDDLANALPQDQNELRRQLFEIKRQNEQFKEELRKKEEETQKYKKQLLKAKAGTTS